jgi:hypothetical protein
VHRSFLSPDFLAKSGINDRIFMRGKWLAVTVLLGHLNITCRRTKETTLVEKHEYELYGKICQKQHLLHAKTYITKRVLPHVPLWDMWELSRKITNLLISLL